jgi:hypothetical protein
MSKPEGVPNEIIFAVDEAPEGGFTAHALGYSIVTEADTWEELKEMVRDAVHCAFEEGRVPPVIRLHLVRDQLIAS